MLAGLQLFVASLISSQLQYVQCTPSGAALVLFFILLTFVVELDIKRRREAFVARPNCVFPALVLLLGGPLFCAGVLGLAYVVDVRPAQPSPLPASGFFSTCASGAGLHAWPGLGSKRSGFQHLGCSTHRARETLGRETWNM